jgi:hypothetical protein
MGDRSAGRTIRLAQPPVVVETASYVTGYEPIRSASGDVIGIYYVGYLKK